MIEDLFFGDDEHRLAGFSFPREFIPFETTTSACRYFSDLEIPMIRRRTIELFQSSFLDGYTNNSIEMLESLVLARPFSAPIAIPISSDILQDLFKRSVTRHLGPLDKAFFMIEELLRSKDVSGAVVDIGKKNILYQHSFPKVRDLLIFILQNTKICISDIRRFSKKLGLEYEHEGEIKTFYNYMNMMLHNFAVESSMRPRESKKRGYFVCSAIHPIYDDYIDSGMFDASFPARLSEYLNGSSFDPKNQYERSIFVLLEELKILFPLSKHKTLWHTLSELHDAQVRSHMQSFEDLTLEQTLEISFEKGGLAFAFYGYVVCGGLTELQFAHFYSMGAIFQLMDDLHDVEDDLTEGVMTVFTKDVKENGAIRRSLLGLVSMQDAFECKTGLVYDFKNPKLVRLIEMIGVRYDTTRFIALSAQFVDCNVMEFFREKYFLNKLSIESLFQNTREHENLDNYLLIIDRLMQFGRMRAHAD